ncbi:MULTISPECIES: hypothetical protein [unclassified Egicoccus]|uniref:hypothetical protein n=1 Tax=unclassified Egicoccus TaxID=2635606 RepID=UPI00359E22E0
MGEFVDFDQAWAEQAANAPTFKAFGRTFTLPISPPLKLTLLAMRAAQRADAEAEVDETTVLDSAAALVGRDTVKELLDAGISMDQLGDVVRFAMESYSKRSAGRADTGPPTAGTEQPEPSSPTGDTSNPTSSGSTDWIS